MVIIDFEIVWQLASTVSRWRRIRTKIVSLGTRLIQPECDWVCGARQICESLTISEERQATRTPVPRMYFAEAVQRLQACFAVKDIKIN